MKLLKKPNHDYPIGKIILSTFVFLSGLIFKIPAVGAVSLDYTGSGFTEDVADDGSISGSIISTLTGDLFKDTDADNILDIGAEVTIGNVPTGLTPLVSLSSANGSDGTTWVNRTTPEANDWRDITYANGLFVAVASTGTNNRVMTSPDGINWTSRTSAGDSNWYGVIYGNDTFVAVASSLAADQVMTSPDGINWTSRTGAGGAGWRGVAYGNSIFVAVANGSDATKNIMTSPDGINWTYRTNDTSNNLLGITYGNGLFVTIAGGGTGNRVTTSPDGINWTVRTTPEDNTWNDITYGNGLFVAVSSNGTSRVMTSPNGINWTSRAAAESTNWNGVAYGNGIFVAVAIVGTNQVMYSSDGFTWVSAASANNSWWGRIAYGSNRFAAVAFNGAGERIMTSEGDLDIATLSLTGNAVSHTSGDDVSDLTYVFADAAFVAGDASNVTNSGFGGAYSTNLGITFTGEPPSSGDSPSTSNGSSTPKPSFCSILAPITAPKLFLINRETTEATVYFNPILGSDGYAIYYGEKGTANTHSVIINRPTNHLGIVSHTIKDLLSGTQYFYRVAATSGCAVGPFSNILADNQVIYYNNIDVINILGIQEIDVEKLDVQEDPTEDEKESSGEIKGEDDESKTEKVGNKIDSWLYIFLIIAGSGAGFILFRKNKLN